MKNILRYKGYCTKVDFSAEDGILFGKIEGIRDLINFECDNASDVESAFHDAVNDYLEFCQEVGKEPDKEYSGTFNVRITPELHRKAAMVAYQRNQSLNQIVEDSMEAYLNERYESEISLRETVATLTTVIAMTTSVDYSVPKVKPAYKFPTNSALNMRYLEQ